jgi:hypothetical protein
MSSCARNIAGDPEVEAAKQRYVTDRRRRSLPKRAAFGRLVDAVAAAAIRHGLKVTAERAACH